MIKTKIFTLLAGVVIFLATGISVQAEVQTLAVAVDESQILQLPAQPGAIIIGNPAVADVSIQGQKLFVHGRSFGQTNLIILDLQGNQIASFNLVGRLAQDSLLTVFRGHERFSYSCAGTCETNMQVGDDKDYVERIKKQTSDKFGLATGSQTAETKAPEAPQ
jgi:hypothetical protein